MLVITALAEERVFALETMPSHRQERNFIINKTGICVKLFFLEFFSDAIETGNVLRNRIIFKKKLSHAGVQSGHAS